MDDSHRAMMTPLSRTYGVNFPRDSIATIRGTWHSRSHGQGFSVTNKTVTPVVAKNLKHGEEIAQAEYLDILRPSVRLLPGTTFLSSLRSVQGRFPSPADRRLMDSVDIDITLTLLLTERMAVDQRPCNPLNVR